MFANPLYSLALLAVPVLIYFLIIRPRLKVKLTDTYAHIDSFWGRVRARIYAFRSFWVGVSGILLTALPDILVVIAPVDFTGILPQPWPAYTGVGTSIALTLVRAFATKPDSQPA